MQNPKSLSELLDRGGSRLTSLKARSLARAAIIDLVRADLPPRLAAAVSGAGLEHGRLTIGVTGAVWASRLRYMTESIRKRVADAQGITIIGVRIRVVPPPSARSP